MFKRIGSLLLCLAMLACAPGALAGQSFWQSATEAISHVDLTAQTYALSLDTPSGNVLLELSAGEDVFELCVTPPGMSAVRLQADAEALYVEMDGMAYGIPYTEITAFLQNAALIYSGASTLTGLDAALTGLDWDEAENDLVALLAAVQSAGGITLQSTYASDHTATFVAMDASRVLYGFIEYVDALLAEPARAEAMLARYQPLLTALGVVGADWDAASMRASWPGTRSQLLSGLASNTSAQLDVRFDLESDQTSWRFTFDGLYPHWSYEFIKAELAYDNGQLRGEAHIFQEGFPGGDGDTWFTLDGTFGEQALLTLQGGYADLTQMDASLRLSGEPYDFLFDMNAAQYSEYSSPQTFRASGAVNLSAPSMRLSATSRGNGENIATVDVNASEAGLNFTLGNTASGALSYLTVANGHFMYHDGNFHLHGYETTEESASGIDASTLKLDQSLLYNTDADAFTAICSLASRMDAPTAARPLHIMQAFSLGDATVFTLEHTVTARTTALERLSDGSIVWLNANTLQSLMGLLY